MSAPEGNKFWMLRSKHGRDKLFASPELMWEAATEYFEWCDDNPWHKNEALKGGDMAGRIIQVPTQRPYTLSGLCLYLNVNTQYFSDFKNALKPEEEGFSLVIAQIEETIRTQKFEGAAVGAFNANIIARDLGLSEKQEMNGEFSLSLRQITGMEIK